MIGLDWFLGWIAAAAAEAWDYEPKHLNDDTLQATCRPAKG